MSAKRVVIAAGGTGGHSYPGMAIACALRARGWEPLLVVREGDPSLARLEAESLPSLPVDLSGLPRRPDLNLIRFSWKLGVGMRLLSRALTSFRPDLVLGMGGYLTFPLAYAAWRRGVPRAVHESNAVLGLANKAASALGCTVLWGLPPGGTGTVVGTPVRPALWTRRDPSECRRALGLDPARATLLAFGGSQGAKGINTALAAALKTLDLPALQVLLLAGKGKADEVREAYRGVPCKTEVREYLEDMGAAYGAADLVLCRAGAGTLAELCVQRKPALLVPYPHAAADHQDVNARVFENAGAAMRLREAELGSRLGSVLSELLKSPQADAKRTAMAEAYGKMPLPTAEKTTEILIQRLETLAQR
ncbi:MAG: UDP-N-acetylglucosamine--N-acetylmuramyl-(pentapeptide) pyrophosphoryl-undecaprenol N-acetylglucosamine transferase [Elusimicrobiota bacterium]